MSPAAMTEAMSKSVAASASQLPDKPRHHDALGEMILPALLAKLKNYFNNSLDENLALTGVITSIVATILPAWSLKRLDPVLQDVWTVAVKRGERISNWSGRVTKTRVRMGVEVLSSSVDDDSGDVLRTSLTLDALADEERYRPMLESFVVLQEFVVEFAATCDAVTRIGEVRARLGADRSRE